MTIFGMYVYDKISIMPTLLSFCSPCVCVMSCESVQANNECNIPVDKILLYLAIPDYCIYLVKYRTIYQLGLKNRCSNCSKPTMLENDVYILKSMWLLFKCGYYSSVATIQVWLLFKVPNRVK